MDRHPRFLLGALAAGAVLLVTAAGGAARAAESELDAAREVTGLWDGLEAFYAENPALTSSPGSGWKPYHRMRDFHEQRMQDGLLPPADARWKAWQEKRARALALGSAARSATWFTLGPTNFSGRILALAFHPTDPSIVYAGSASGGLWRTSDGGSSWAPLTDELPSLAIGGVAVSATDPDLVVIGTGEATNNIDRVTGVGILRSTDAGATWQTTSVSLSTGSGHGFHFVEAGPNGTFLAGATDGLYRSTDGGATWDTVKVGGNWYDAKWKPGSPSTVYTVKGRASAGNGVKISTDDGATWTSAGTGQPASFSIGKSKIAVTPADPEMIYAHYVDLVANSTLGIWRSTDGGATWSARNTTTNIVGQQGWYNLSLAVDPDDPARVISGGVSLYLSTNGATSFSTIGGGSVHVDHHAIGYEPGSASALWVGSDGGCWRSTNDGGSWTGRNSGLVTYQFYDICVNDHPTTPYYVLGGTQDNGTDKWSGTTTWSEGLFADGMVCNVSKTNGTTVYAEIQYGSHYRSLSSGSGGWTQINGGIGGEGSRWVAPVADDWSDGTHLYTSTATTLYRSTNSGGNWTAVANQNPVWISISPVDGDVVWTLTNIARYTTDDGATWNDAAAFGFPVGSPRRILAHPTDPQTVFATFSNYTAVAHIAMSTDMGATWTDVTGDLPSQPVNAIVVDPDATDDWYIGTDVGIWKSVNGGANWVPFDTGFPNVVVEDLEIQRTQRKLVAGTHGRGAWEADIPLPTGAEPSLAAVPRNLMLDAPFPNPVADRTMLRFAAKGAGTVSLDVYDVAGRLVLNLAELPAGDGVIRTTPWFPDGVPNGVYFAVLRADGEKLTRKMVVAR